MKIKIIKIAIITNIITHYREGFYDRLFKRKDIEVTVYCQDHIPGMNLTSIHKKYPNNVHILKFYSANREKISWQVLPWRHIMTNYDIVFVQGNPRVISDAIFSTYLRISGKKVVLWTMAHSFRGNKLTENIRLSWSKIFKFLFVYTDKEVDFLHQHGYRNKIILGMNNGLDQKKIDDVINLWTDNKLALWLSERKLEKRTIILSSARLESKNRFEMVLKALPKIILEIPDVLWCLIGSGVEEERLRLETDLSGLSKHVLFIGSIYDEYELAPYFLSAKLFIHPASIGLSLMHSFGYGLPVVTHGNPNLHNPEYAAFAQEITGRNFIENDINSLANVVVSLIKDAKARQIMKLNVRKLAQEKYNVDIMVNRFIQIAKIAVHF